MAANGVEVEVGARAEALATGARVFTVASVGNGATPESHAPRIKLIAKSNVIARSDPERSAVFFRAQSKDCDEAISVAL